MTENVYLAQLPGARAGEPVTVRLEQSSRCTSPVSPELLIAVDALRGPAPPGAGAPIAVLEAVPGRPVVSAARIGASRGDVNYTATTEPDVTARIERLVRNPPRVPNLPLVVGDPLPPVEDSEVRFLNGQQETARELAAALGIERLVQVAGDNAGFEEPRAAVAVIVGRDLR